MVLQAPGMAMSPTVHFVYLHGDAISCPQAIPGHLIPLLKRRGWRVRAHAWDAFGPVPHAAGDILLGHAHPLPGTAFRASLAAADWGRVLMMSPYNGDPRQVGWLSPLVARVDRYVGICGPYWARQWRHSENAWWGERFLPLELAVDRRDFPRLKRRFNRPGKRRLLYVGRSEWPKNPKYLEALAAARPNWSWGWMGSGRRLRGFTAHGPQDFRRASARALVRGYDFLLSVGEFDANPSTLLEAMAWGLIPVCTPQSGYQGEPGIVNVPLNDLAGALAVLDALQSAPEARLQDLRAANDRALAKRFTWTTVAERLDAALRLPRPAPLAVPLSARVGAWRCQLCSPLGLLPSAWRLGKERLKEGLRSFRGA